MASGGVKRSAWCVRHHLLSVFGYTLVVFYHFGNGIRHLVWDAGYGFELDVARFSGMLVLAFAAVMTVLVWIIVAVAG